MQYNVKKGIADCYVYNTNLNSFLSWKRKSHYFIPILANVCINYSSNAETDSKRLSTGTIYITSYFKFWFQLLTYLVSWEKNKIIRTSPATMPVWRGLCLMWLDSKYLSQKVDLHSTNLLDANLFIRHPNFRAYLLDRGCWLVYHSRRNAHSGRTA